MSDSKAKVVIKNRDDLIKSLKEVRELISSAEDLLRILADDEPLLDKQSDELLRIADMLAKHDSSVGFALRGFMKETRKL